MEGSVGAALVYLELILKRREGTRTGGGGEYRQERYEVEVRWRSEWGVGSASVTCPCKTSSSNSFFRVQQSAAQCKIVQYVQKEKIQKNEKGGKLLFGQKK